MALDQKQTHQHDDRDRQDRNLRGRSRHVQSFDGAQHRYGGSDGSVGKKQRRTQYAERAIDFSAGARALGIDHQSGQRQHAAFALVIGVQYHADVFEKDHQHERPEDQRKDAEDVLRRHRDVRTRETGRHGI